MRRIAVGDVMTRNFISVSPSANLLECAKQLVKERINGLLIVKDKKLVGIITSRDVLWAVTKSPKINLSEINVMKIATRKVAVIKPSADIAQALNKMKILNFKRLPVLSKGKLLGIITLKDILRVDPELYRQSSDLFDVKEEEDKLRNISKSSALEGFCENCGAFSELLMVNDRALCPDCREELY